MLVVNLTAGTTSTTAIPLVSTLNTNTSLSLKNNAIEVLNQGVYEISGYAILTSTASGNYGLGIYVNEDNTNILSEASATGASETVTIPVYDVIKVNYTTASENVSITFMPINSPTIVGGVISVKKIN